MASGQYIIIIGCGHLGAHIANHLSRKGNAIVVIDDNEQSFNRLSLEFSGFRIEGDATELAVLTRAKMHQADMVIAVTRDENINLMVAQVAKINFGVKRVLSRTYDPGREALCRQLGVETICTTSIMAELFLNRIFEEAKK